MSEVGVRRNSEGDIRLHPHQPKAASALARTARARKMVRMRPGRSVYRADPQDDNRREMQNSLCLNLNATWVPTACCATPVRERVPMLYVCASPRLHSLLCCQLTERCYVIVRPPPLANTMRVCRGCVVLHCNMAASRNHDRFGVSPASKRKHNHSRAPTTRGGARNTTMSGGGGKAPIWYSREKHKEKKGGGVCAPLRRWVSGASGAHPG
jgi:hypothetical protein